MLAFPCQVAFCRTLYSCITRACCWTTQGNKEASAEAWVLVGVAPNESDVRCSC